MAPGETGGPGLAGQPAPGGGPGASAQPRSSVTEVAEEEIPPHCVGALFSVAYSALWRYRHCSLYCTGPARSVGGDVSVSRAPLTLSPGPDQRLDHRKTELSGAERICLKAWSRAHRHLV